MSGQTITLRSVPVTSVNKKPVECAAEKGDPEAQVQLGMLYLNGTGVFQNYNEAINWFKLATGSGNKRATSKLAEMSSAGHNISQDITN